MYRHSQLFKLKNKIFTFIGVFKFWRLLLPGSSEWFYSHWGRMRAEA